MRQRARLDVFLGISGRGVRTAAAASVIAVVAALLSGCGGASSSGATNQSATTSTTATSQTVAERALFTYAACMRGKGVNVPDPVRGTNGRYAFPKIPAKVLNAAGVRAKAQACAAKLPRGSFRGGNRPSSAQSAAFQKFTACMRKNGVPFGPRPGQRGQPPAGQAPASPYGRGRGVPIVPGQGFRGQGRGGQAGFFNSNDPKVKAALAKCRSLLPAGFGDRGTP